MAKSKQQPPEEPACWAIVHPGLEDIAADEILRDFGGEVKKKSKGIVVFRPKRLDRDILQLRTTEDVFVYAWGTDQLSYRSTDLDSIRKWTALEADWATLLKIHHSIRPKPKGKTSWRMVVQMTGEHGYRRYDATKALARGLVGKFPASWPEAEENASVEFWLTIHGSTGICGIRISDRTMRHRSWKVEHFPASLRPTVAACMARVAELKPNQVVVDPMCGVGTILGECWTLAKRKARGDMAAWNSTFIGGDLDPHHVKLAGTNLRALGEFELRPWDARRLPLEPESVDRIVCNPPFGKQLSTPEEIVPLYQQFVRNMDRVLKVGGIAVLLVAEPAVMKEAIHKYGWKQLRYQPIRVLGQPAVIMAYRKEPPL